MNQERDNQEQLAELLSSLVDIYESDYHGEAIGSYESLAQEARELLTKLGLRS